MKIVPAIDLIDGQNVRLTKGDYGQKTDMGRTPQEILKYYNQFDNVTRIHVVDLLGALEQGARESDLVAELKSLTDLPLEIGGGLRDMETIEAYANRGIDYFILGTKAIQDLDWLKKVIERFPGRVFVGIDARGERIYINGWSEDSGWLISDYLKEIEPLNLAGIIYTDIEKDGMMQGPNFERTGKLQEQTQHKVVASGGIRNKADLDRLQELGIHEAIVGKAAHNDEFWEDFNG